MSFAPAISDADLARLLGMACLAAPVPDGLAGRIMAALPAEMPAQPAVAAPRRFSRRAGRRWLRPTMAIGASLALASAVAASLADAPMLRQVLAPVLERIGLAEPAVTTKPVAVRRAPAQPPAQTAPQPSAEPALRARPDVAALARLRTSLPDAPAAELPRIAPPAMLAGPPAMAPSRAAPRPERPPEMAIAPPIAALPATPPMRVPETVTAVRDAATVLAPAGTEAPVLATGPAPAGNISAEIAVPAATMQALRQARQNGTLTPDQARQLRA